MAGTKKTPKTQNPNLTIADVKHVAQLAKLDLTEEELNKFQHQLSDILTYVQQLQTIDTSGIEETSQITGLTNVLHEDEVGESLAVEQALSNAKHTYNGYVKVPGILETE